MVEQGNGGEFEQLKAQLEMSLKKIEQAINGFTAIEVETGDVAQMIQQMQELKDQVTNALQQIKELSAADPESKHPNDLIELGSRITKVRVDIANYFLSVLETTEPEANFADLVKALVTTLLADKKFLNPVERNSFTPRVQALNEIVRAQNAPPESETPNVPENVTTPIRAFETVINNLITHIDDQGGTFNPSDPYNGPDNAYVYLLNQFTIFRTNADVQRWLSYMEKNYSPKLDESQIYDLYEQLTERQQILRRDIMMRDPAFRAVRDRYHQIATEVAGGSLNLNGTTDVSGRINDLRSLAAALEGNFGVNPELSTLAGELNVDVRELVDQLVFSEWIRNLETTHAELATLRTRIAAALPVAGTDPQAELTAMDTALAAVRTAVGGAGYNAEQMGHIERTYLNPGQARQQELRTLREQYENQQAIADFDANVTRLRTAIAAVPATRGTLTKDNITDLSQELENSHHQAEASNWLDKPANVLPEISAAIDTINRQFQAARERLTRFLTELSKPKEVDELTDEELTEELLKSDIPIESRGKILDLEGRERALGQAYYARLGSAENTNPDPENQKKLRLKMRVVLNRIDDALTYEEPASADVTGLEKSSGGDTRMGLLNLTLPREQLLAATTEHPEIGWQLKFILRHIIETAALRYDGRTGEGEKFVRRGGTEMWINEDDPRQHDDIVLQRDTAGGRLRIRRGGASVTLLPDEPVGANDYVIREGQPDRFYTNLIADGGRKRLLNIMIDEAIAELPPGMQLSAADLQFVRPIAHNLFVSFDLLSISLAQAQHRTQTRGHNTGLSDINRTAFISPLADTVHSSFRYGGNQHYFGNWILALYPKIPDNGFFGKEGNVHELQELRHKEILYLECFFDTKQIVGKLPLPEFCEALFPSTFDMMTLQPGESVIVGNTLVDRAGNQIDLTAEPDKKQKQANFANYYTAQAGWKEFLEKVYQELPTITREQVIEQTKEGSKGGFLGEILGSMLGRAKMFDGPHMHEAMPPLLTFYLYRIFAAFGDTDPAARKELFQEVVKALKDSRDGGGLAAYKKEINQVLTNISASGSPSGTPPNDEWKPGPYLAPMDLYRRWDQRKAYLKELWNEKHPGKAFPLMFNGNEITLIAADPEVEHFGKMMRLEAKIEPPFGRGGKMIQEKESGGH